MMSERDTKDDLKSEESRISYPRISICANPLKPRYDNNTYLWTGPELRDPLRPEWTAGGTSPAEARLATLLKKDPDRRKDIPTSGYNQKTCKRVKYCHCLISVYFLRRAREGEVEGW